MDNIVADSSLKIFPEQIIKLEQRILKYKEAYHLQLILREEFKSSALSFEEIKLFTELQSDLNKHVFTSLPCRIKLCDGNFKEIYTPVSE